MTTYVKQVLPTTKTKSVVYLHTLFSLLSLKGHCHGHFWAFLVKRHQNYDKVHSTMQEMLLERKGKEI